MFPQDNQADQSNAAIPDQSIDGAMQAQDDTNAQSNGISWGHPGTPLNNDNQSSPAPDNSNSDSAPNNSDAPTPNSDTLNDLLNIKQQALGELSPLVSHLDQSPEERFRTVMMMIQATDDQSKIQEAFSAAQAIEDEKGRAQALLDVINEINYFTQHHDNA
ncbi:MAG TPA: hypothetical protein VG992_01880 [Candidatus Saccharimonadales bacterium]|nr:hypothetical protein [Candidatus Saccharimonadales bacterium]